MTVYGVTPDGFVKRTLEDLLAQVEGEERDNIDQSLDVSSSSPMGQINVATMKPASELWDALQATYTGVDPDKNTGDAQDAVAAITGTKRIGAAASYVKETLNLNAGVTVPAGSIVAQAGNPTVQFKLIGPEPAPGAAVVPGGVTSVGAGTYFGRFQCLVTGPVAAPAGTLSNIITPITGWNSATNAADAVLGRNVEEADEMRARREDELQAQGTSPVDALEGDLLELVGMQQCTVFENYTDAPDVNGVPPHSFEALCFDGASPAVANDLIAQTIWDGKAGGIRPYGSSTGNATDRQGNIRVVAFSRPTPRPVYFNITITTTDAYQGDAALKAAIVAFAISKTTGLKMGDDVVLAAFYATIFGVGGSDVVSFKAGFAPSPVGTSNLSIAVRELATFDTSQIVIHS